MYEKQNTANYNKESYDCSDNVNSLQSNTVNINFYAALAYIRHFIFVGCYDNNPWYLVTNLAGHLDLAGFYYSKCPAKFVPRY